jgi:hypothetical protein
MSSLPQIRAAASYEKNRLKKEKAILFSIVLFAFPLDLQVSLLILNGIVDFL